MWEDVPKRHAISVAALVAPSAETAALHRAQCSFHSGRAVPMLIVLCGLPFFAIAACHPVTLARIRMDDQMLAENKLVSSLSIEQARSTDSGIVECTVTNPYGRESVHTRLVIQGNVFLCGRSRMMGSTRASFRVCGGWFSFSGMGTLTDWWDSSVLPDKPSPPTKLRVIETTSTSITLQWETPPDGNSPIKSYVITYRQQGRFNGSDDLRDEMRPEWNCRSC